VALSEDGKRLYRQQRGPLPDDVGRFGVNGADGVVDAARRDGRVFDDDPYAGVPPYEGVPPLTAPPDDDDHDRRDDDDDRPKVWDAADLAPAARPRWLATNRLPRAAVSLLIGDEGIGKSLLWVLVVAHITTGKPLPGFGIPARDPGRVMLVITEDDWSTVVLPRLQIVGADLAMIRVICIDKDGSGAPIFPRDLPLIRNADPKPDLVVVDCWLDTVPAVLNVRDAQQARLALHPWKDMATTTGAVIWLLGHSNRVGNGSVRDRYGATYVLRQKARMTIWAMKDDDGALLAGPEKANGAIITVASRFTIRPILCFEPTDEHDGTVPILEYAGISHMTIREHFEATAAAQAAAGGRRSDTSDSVAWLDAQLSGGPRWSTDIHAAAERDGITKRQLDAAKQKLNVESTRESGTGPWFMRLPQHSGHVPGAHNHTEPPTSPECDCGDSGENQKYASSSEDAQNHATGYMGTSGDADSCDCGAQLTSPASIRYGQCQECRLAASNDTSDAMTTPRVSKEHPE
jgi:AAA domain